MSGLLACALVSTAFAGDSADAPRQMVRIGASVDYTWTAMYRLNKQLKDNDTGVDVRTFGSGIVGMLDFDLALGHFLMVGARTGYLYCVPASARYDFVLPAVYSQATTVNASLIPLEVGLSLNVGSRAAPVSLTTGIFGGYGFAFTSYENDISALGQKRTYTVHYDGGTFVGELLAAVSLNLSSAVALNINGGYRLADVQRMVQSKDASFNAIPGFDISVGEKGDVLKGSDNKDLPVDFSGFNIGVGISVGF
jgi:hypothetical protein